MKNIKDVLEPEDKLPLPSQSSEDEESDQESDDNDEEENTQETNPSESVFMDTELWFYKDFSIKLGFFSKHKQIFL